MFLNACLCSLPTAYHSSVQDIADLHPAAPYPFISFLDFFALGLDFNKLQKAFSACYNRKTFFYPCELAR